MTRPFAPAPATVADPAPAITAAPAPSPAELTPAEKSALFKDFGRYLSQPSASAGAKP